MQKEKKRENVYKIIANDDKLHSISDSFTMVLIL